ncbi:MAG: tetratricopeptide repeat protein [Isosphaeraceae bacterium]|nr:tetratricopeptide repeat protein [Isosphaeraceae bacterium]
MMDQTPVHAGHESATVPADRLATLLTVVVLASLVLAAFAPVLANGFVNFDDHQNFKNNPHLLDPVWAQLRWAWSTFWVGAYQPLFWMLVGLEFRLFGLNPLGFHIVSLVLHAAVVTTLYFVIVALLNRAGPDHTPAGRRARRLGAAVAAALFAIHPLRVEPVAWATCQNYLMCSLFALLAVLAYCRAHPVGQAERPGWRAATLGLYVASLLAHATSLGLPVVLLALDYVPLRRITDGPSARRAVREKWPFVLAALVFTALGFAAKQSAHSLTGIAGLDPTARLAVAGYGTWFYLVKTALPWGLHVYYLIPPWVGLAAPTFLLATLGVLALTLAAVACRKYWPGLLAAWVSYLAILGPNSGLVAFSNQVAADRYSYLAMMGLFAAAGGLLSRVVQSRPRVVLVLAAPVLLMLGAATRAQCRTWRDAETLWSRTLALGSPANAVAHYNYAVVLSARGQHAAAVGHLEQAVRHQPRDAGLWFTLGAELFWVGRVAEAIERYQQALRIDPDYIDARLNLAQALAADGKPGAAIVQYRTVLRRHPNEALCRLRLGVLLATQERFAEARDQLVEAVRLEPGSADAHLALGRVLAELGRLDQAARHLDEAVRLRPDSADAHFALGLVLADLGRRHEAASHFHAVLRLRPGHPAARQELARTLP